MKLLFAFFVLFSLTASAIDLKPGLWNIDISIKQEGNKVDPMAEMKKAMKDMPKAQREAIMKSMGENALGILGGSKGIKQCFTKEMIDKADFSDTQEDGCKTQVKKESSSKYITTYKCKDGMSGRGVVKIKNSKSYVVNMTMNDKKGQKAKMSQKGSFISSDCGSVEALK